VYHPDAGAMVRHQQLAGLVQYVVFGHHLGETKFLKRTLRVDDVIRKIHGKDRRALTIDV